MAAALWRRFGRRLIGCGSILALVLCGASGAWAQASRPSATRFPIVLQPGLADIGFFGVANALRAGGARVFETQSDAFNSSTRRGQQLVDQIEDVLAISGASKVNLVGHSQGGLDARFVLGTRPELVASVTTVGTPHKGADLADVISNPVLTAASLPLAQALINLIAVATGQPPVSPGQILRALDQLTTRGTNAFTRRFPAGVPTSACGQGAASVNGIPVFSWGGTSLTTNAADLSDALLATVSIVQNEANDGLVGRCSNHFGTVIRDNFRMNHLDEINQLTGLRGADDPVAQYRAQASRLRGIGL